MSGQLLIMPRFDEIFQLGIHRRRNARQKLSEFQDAFCGVHSKFHLAMKQPDEYEMPALDLAEAAKDATVGVRLQQFSDNIY
jgi:hypothetical protein